MNQLNEKLHLWTTALILFTMPVYHAALPYIIMLLALNWLVLSKHRSWFSRRNFNLSGVLLISYYVLHIAGMIYSTSVREAIIDLEIKSSFVVLPLIYSLSPRFDESKMRTLFISFVGGCFVAVMICFGTIANNYFFIHPGAEYFTHGKHFSILLHLGYFAMYLNLSIILILYMLFHGSWKFSTAFRIFLISCILLFVVAIFFTVAKNGILTLGLLALVLSVLYAIKYKKWIIGIGSLLFMFGVFALLIYKVPGNIERFENALNAFTLQLPSSDTHESSEVRLLAWRSALAVFKANPLIGVGTGDVDEELLEYYNSKGYTHLEDIHLNPHNQYLQSAVALGILGLLILPVIFIIAFLGSIKERNLAKVFFVIIIALAAVTESILEVQAGVIFFALFYSLFLISQDNSENILEFNRPLKEATLPPP